MTTKLTTYWLDVLGRVWTTRHEKRWIQEQFGRLWTHLDSAPSAPKPQVAGSIPVPPAIFSLISWGLEPLSFCPLTAVVTAVRAADALLPCTARCAALELTPMKMGTRPRTGRPQWGRFQAASHALMNTADRTASVSKTAGRRCESCPACPSLASFQGQAEAEMSM